MVRLPADKQGQEDKRSGEVETEFWGRKGSRSHVLFTLPGRVTPTLSKPLGIPVLEDLQRQCLIRLGDSFWSLRILTVRKFGFVSKFRLVAHPFPLTLISGGDGAHPVNTCEGCHQNSDCPSCPSLSASGSVASAPFISSLDSYSLSPDPPMPHL